MASPHVAGVMALVMGSINSTVTVAEVKTAITDHGTKDVISYDVGIAYTKSTKETAAMDMHRGFDAAMTTMTGADSGLSSDQSSLMLASMKGKVQCHNDDDCGITRKCCVESGVCIASSHVCCGSSTTGCMSSQECCENAGNYFCSSFSGTCCGATSCGLNQECCENAVGTHFCSSFSGTCCGQTSCGLNEQCCSEGKGHCARAHFDSCCANGVCGATDTCCNAGKTDEEPLCCGANFECREDGQGCFSLLLEKTLNLNLYFSDGSAPPAPKPRANGYQCNAKTRKCEAGLNFNFTRTECEQECKESPPAPGTGFKCNRALKTCQPDPASKIILQECQAECM
eukprot:g1779.t1